MVALDIVLWNFALVDLCLFRKVINSVGLLQEDIPNLFAVMNTKQIYHDWNADYYYNVVHTSAAQRQAIFMDR